MQASEFILIAMALTSALLCLVFAVAWSSLGRPRHALTWSLTFALATAQWSTNVFRDWFPEVWHYWAASNLFAFAAATAATIGHLQRLQRPITWRVWAVPIAATVVLIFAITPPAHDGLRMGLAPIHGALLLSYVSLLLIRARPRLMAAEWATVCATLAFAITQLAAGVVALAQGPVMVEALVLLYLKINFLVLPGAYVGMSLFVVLMLASDKAIELKEAAVRDQLTGLLNRRGLREGAARSLAYARRSGRSLAAIIVDLDRFKSVNDRFGHETGDQVLKHVADLLQSRARQEDLVARWGGEEFVLLLVGADPVRASRIADEYRATLAESPLETAQGPISITASYGVTVSEIADSQLDDLLRRADQALYRCKREGRDRVEFEMPATLIDA